MDKLSFSTFSWQIRKLVVYKHPEFGHAMGIVMSQTGDIYKVLLIDSSSTPDSLIHIIEKDIPAPDSYVADLYTKYPPDEIDYVKKKDIVKEYPLPSIFDKYASDVYFDGSPAQDIPPENLNFTNPIDDKQLRRINPKRYDKRHDWYSEAPDSDLSNKFDNTIKGDASLKLSWQLPEKHKYKIKIITTSSSYGNSHQTLNVLASCLLDAYAKIEDYMLEDIADISGQSIEDLRNDDVFLEHVDFEDYDHDFSQSWIITKDGVQIYPKEDTEEEYIEASLKLGWAQDALKLYSYEDLLKVIGPNQIWKATGPDFPAGMKQNRYLHTGPAFELKGTMLYWGDRSMGITANDGRWTEDSSDPDTYYFDIGILEYGAPYELIKGEPHSKLSWQIHSEIVSVEDLPKVIKPNQVWEIDSNRGSWMSSYLITLDNIEIEYRGSLSPLIKGALWANSPDFIPIEDASQIYVALASMYERFRYVGERKKEDQIESSLDWEIENVISYGAFDGYDLVKKLIQKTSGQPAITVLTYKDFPQNVRTFVKDYYYRELEEFPDLVAHLNSLRVYAAEKPEFYDSNVGAEYFDTENLILSYIPLDDLFTKYSRGLVHEIDHVVQYYLKGVGKEASVPSTNDPKYYSDNKFYIQDKAEIKARGAELAFEKKSWAVVKEELSFEDFLNTFKPQQVWKCNRTDHPESNHIHLHTDCSILHRGNYSARLSQAIYQDSIKLDMLFARTGSARVFKSDEPFELVADHSNQLNTRSWQIHNDDILQQCNDILHSEGKWRNHKYVDYKEISAPQARTLHVRDIVTSRDWKPLPNDKFFLLQRNYENVFSACDLFRLRGWVYEEIHAGIYPDTIDRCLRSIQNVASLKLGWQVQDTNLRVGDFVVFITDVETPGEILINKGTEGRVVTYLDKETTGASDDQVGIVFKGIPLFKWYVKQSDAYKYVQVVDSLKFSWQIHNDIYTFEEFVKVLAPNQVWEMTNANTDSKYLHIGPNYHIVGKGPNDINMYDAYCKNIIETPEIGPYYYDVARVSGPFKLIKGTPKTSNLKDKNEKLFNERYQNYGEDGGNLFWSDTSSQYARFKLLSQVGNLDKASVLDVGAGFGDFLDFAQEYGIKIGHYVGVDIIPAIIEVAERKHPYNRFEVRDVIKAPFGDNAFDFIIGSGLFALEDEQWEQSVEEMLLSMYKMAKQGVAVNFLSGNILSNEFRTTTEEEVLGIAHKITDKVKVVSKLHDDITLYMYK